MDESPEKNEKVSSSNRRNNKPLMEKRRRQRINDCLVQLKSLVLQAMNKDTTQYSKLEKADILEMTVKHLKMVQRQQMNVAMTSDPNMISRYRAGFNECAAEIARYLDTVNGGNPELKTRVMGYLANSMMQFPVIPVYQGVPYHMQITSPVTSQQAFGQLSMPVASSTPYPQHYHQREHFHVTSKREIKPQPLSISPIKTEPTHGDVQQRNVHAPSPVRRVPSPCDSDSGLSDSSNSFSHDENGNYSHFNVNGQQARLDTDHRMHSRTEQFRHEPSPPHDYVTGRRTSPKRPCEDGVDLMSNKRVRANTGDVNFANERQFGRNGDVESMWRPW